MKEAVRKRAFNFDKRKKPSSTWGGSGLIGDLFDQLFMKGELECILVRSNQGQLSTTEVRSLRDLSEEDISMNCLQNMLRAFTNFKYAVWFDKRHLPVFMDLIESGEKNTKNTLKLILRVAYKRMQELYASNFHKM
ncbi:hypothetical protein Tco_0451814 [Tanacetum coccineum]